jgi:hypothetical protein
MKTRPLLIVLSLGVLIATAAMVGRQHQQLSALRTEAQDLQSRAEPLTNATPEAVEAPPIAPHSGPSLELLRLRSQVGQLERRKRELAGGPEENKKLQAQRGGKIANGTSGGALPAGYVRKSEAKFAGFGSPEDSLHSFLWAIEHRDLPTLIQLFAPEQAKQISAEIERRGSSEDLFKDAGRVPGWIVTGREQKDDGTIELRVRIDPNDDSTGETMRFKAFDGKWRLVSGGP